MTGLFFKATLEGGLHKGVSQLLLIDFSDAGDRIFWLKEFNTMPADALVT